MKSRRANRKGSRRGGNGQSLQAFESETVTVHFREVPLQITQATSGTGGLTNLSGNASATSATSYNIDPYNIGGRLNEFAHLFAQYRFKSLRLNFIPQSTSAGVVDTVVGETTTPAYENRAFSWAISPDPSITAGTFTTTGNIGKFGNTSRSSFLVLPKNNNWLFTSTSAASPTAIDLRMASPAKLIWVYYGTSTTATNNLGFIQYVGSIQFRHPTNDVAAVGSSQVPRSLPPTAENMPGHHRCPNCGYVVIAYDGVVEEKKDGGVGSATAAIGLQKSPPPFSSTAVGKAAKSPVGTSWSQVNAETAKSMGWFGN